MKKIVWLLLGMLLWVTACQPKTVVVPTPATLAFTIPIMPSATVTATETPLPPTPVLITAPFPVFGIETSSLKSGLGLEQLVLAGTSWTRRNGLLWSSVEPIEGSYDWGVLSDLESELQNASSQGIQVVLIVRSAPEWARKIPGSGAYCGPIHPDKLDAFGNFMHELVARYSVPPYNVKYWELWNEPDIDPSYFTSDSVYGCWGDANDPYYGGGYYAEMLKAAYPQIKSANPQAQVLVGGLLLDCDPVNPPEGQDCIPSKFLEGVLQNEGGAYFDGVSFHSYDYYYEQPGQYGNSSWHSAWDTNGPLWTAKVIYLRELLAQYGHSDKYLINSETALLCGRDGKEAPCLTKEFEDTKASYLVQSYAAAVKDEALYANVWYSLFGWRASGLLKQKDQSSFPAFEAYGIAAQKLGEANFVREIQEYPGVKGYEFEREGRRLWVIWSLEGAGHDIFLSESPQAAFDMFGIPLTVTEFLPVTLNPIYVEW